MNSEWFLVPIDGTHKKSQSFADKGGMVPGDTTEHIGDRNPVAGLCDIVHRMNVAPATVDSVGSLPLCRNMCIGEESNIKL